MCFLSGYRFQGNRFLCTYKLDKLGGSAAMTEADGIIIAKGIADDRSIGAMLFLMQSYTRTQSLEGVVMPSKSSSMGWTL